jgi:hypothetical protein
MPVFQHNPTIDRQRALARRPAPGRGQGRIFASMAIGASLLALAALPLRNAWAADLTPHTVGPVTYVCGGVATDEQQQLDREAKNYDMGLLFTKGANGEYLADVEVKMVNNGQEVATFKADGPRCLIKAPASSYQVAATYEGSTKRTTLSKGNKNLQLRW